jgi:peroxiredoxin
MNDRGFGHRVLTALAAFAAVLVVGCGTGAAAPTPEPTATPMPAPTATATPTPVPPTPTATAAPAVRLPQIPVREVELALFSGDTMRLSDLHGQVVVLNFWASWCGPCVTEMPAFDRIYNDYRERGVTFLGIDTQDVELAAKAFADRIDVSYPLAVDETGRLAVEFGQVGSDGVFALPTTVIIGADGRVARTWVGALREDVLRGFLEALVGAS